MQSVPESHAMSIPVVPPFQMTWLEWLSFRYLLRHDRFEESRAIMLRAITRTFCIPAEILFGEPQYSSAHDEYQLVLRLPGLGEVQ